MNCPKCQAELAISERAGIEIDHCPRCRGVWLDRGELDKIVERASRHDADDDDDRWGQDVPREYDRDRSYRKRRSFWSELFD